MINYTREEVINRVYDLFAWRNTSKLSINFWPLTPYNPQRIQFERIQVPLPIDKWNFFGNTMYMFR